MIKLLSLFLFASIGLVCCNTQQTPSDSTAKSDNSHAIVFEEYYPLKKETINIFSISHLTNSDTILANDDSSICKSVIVKGREIFYYDDHLNSSDTTMILTNSFSQGAFYYDKGNLIFSPLEWKYELKNANLDYFEELFPKEVKLDSTYRYKVCPKILKFNFIGFEMVNIKRKTFPDCLKLIVTQDWTTSQYVDTVWFQKGFGVVKWLRGTGRLEEIKL